MTSYASIRLFSYKRVSALAFGACRNVSNGPGANIAVSRAEKNRSTPLAAPPRLGSIGSPYFVSRASKVTSSIPTSNGGATHEDDFIEAVVCQEADIGENQMKQVEL
uniref:Uncharacterized protein n=1 Tax=Anopheles atroparvus TaxID=41427 RepID=A0AAG5CV21_ANOAO